MEEVTPIPDFLRKIKEISTQLASIGEILEETRSVQITLNALPNSYESFIQAVLGADEMPTFDKLSGKLLLEEQRRESR
jgi:hypothetical protein